MEILLIYSTVLEYSSLRAIFDRTKAKLFCLPSIEEGLAFLRKRSLGVVICSADFATARWQDFLSRLTPGDPAPSTIIASRLADDRLWAEVFNLGGYDLLLTPFHSEEVLRVSHHAWESWKSHRCGVAATQVAVA
jgi:DNA-binding NtrC family response regulator